MHVFVTVPIQDAATWSTCTPQSKALPAELGLLWDACRGPSTQLGWHTDVLQQLPVVTSLILHTKPRHAQYQLKFETQPERGNMGHVVYIGTTLLNLDVC
jgi:hypothetical protein